MFSLQEISQNDQIKTNLKSIEDFMDTHGYFDPNEAACNVYANLNRSVSRELSETLHKLTLKEWMTSTNLNTGFAGASGTNYLVPTYVSLKLGLACGNVRDIAPSIAAIFMENQPGDVVNFAALASAYTQKSKGGLGAGGVSVSGSSATSQRFTAPLIVTNELKEDTDYNIVESGIQAAKLAMNQQSNDQILLCLARTTPAGSQSSKQTATAGADTTTPAHLAAISAQLSSTRGGVGMRRADTLICTPETWWDALVTTAGHPEVHPGISGFDAWYGALDTMIVRTDLTTEWGAWSSSRLTNAVSVVLDRASALGIARKNWLRIENYSDPVMDLSGAVISGKQTVSELVCASIGVLTES